MYAYEETWKKRKECAEIGWETSFVLFAQPLSNVAPLSLRKFVYHVVNGLLLIAQWNGRCMVTQPRIRFGFMLWRKKSFYLSWNSSYEIPCISLCITAFYIARSHIDLYVSVSAFTFHFQLNAMKCHLYCSTDIRNNRFYYLIYMKRDKVNEINGETMKKANSKIRNLILPYS